SALHSCISGRRPCRSQYADTAHSHPDRRCGGECLLKSMDTPSVVLARCCLDKYRERRTLGHLALGLHSTDATITDGGTPPGSRPHWESCSTGIGKRPAISAIYEAERRVTARS